MHLEIRKAGKLKKYYLAHSFRRMGKARKIRIYLGANLTREELIERMREATPKLEERARESWLIHDPFETVLSKEELKEIDALEAKACIKVIHLSEDDWKRFTEEFAYDTNAIEGSTIELDEVKGILEKDKWPDKKKSDISETYGVAKAIKFIRKTREHLSLELILEIHRIVFENSKPFAGKFREKGIEVVVTDGRGGIVHRGAPSAHVRSLLSELVRWYGKNRNGYSPLVLAAVVHNQFENIHPFQDGNGRVGRLLLTNILLKNNFPPLNIELKNREEYYAALQAYENGHNLRPTIELMLKECRALRKILKKR